MKQRITEKITTKQYEKSSEMYLKIISQSTPPPLCSIFYPQLGVSQHVAAPSFWPNLPQIVAHILQKAFFKHSLGCIKKTFSQSAHLTLWYIFLNLAAIVRYGNLILILILVKVPQIVTYILQKAFLICSGNIERTGKA